MTATVDQLSQPARGRGTPRVLLVTEGTYPFVVGGVSTWCDRLLRGLDDIDWRVVGVTAGDTASRRAYPLPANVSDFSRIELWAASHRLPRQHDPRPDLPAALARAVLPWASDPMDLVRELVWCRAHPHAVAASFRGRSAWAQFLEAAAEAAGRPDDEVTPGATLDLDAATTLYQVLGWIARAAAVRTPDADMSIVSAAGWAAIPGVIDKALRGTPMMLVEHGIYMREVYLAGVRNPARPGVRLVTTRVSRAFARAAYHCADLIAPCTEAHRRWEVALGADPDRIHPIPNGVEVPAEFAPAPRTKTVVSVARIDPLKDIHTLLRVARVVADRHPDVRFLQYGPVSPGQDRYATSCFDLHRELGLGDVFRFMGHTDRPLDAVRHADVAVLTSISEGFPMAVLEALGQGRPVVATAVGGVPSALQGGGYAVPVRDVSGFASAVCALLDEPPLAEVLGRRGQARVLRKFRLDDMLERYRDAIQLLATSQRPRLRVVAG